MPKKRKAPETFDEWVGAVISGRMDTLGIRQEDLAEATHIPPTNIGRSLRGTRPLSISEFERIASALKSDRAKLAQEALDGFGGIEKLIADHATQRDSKTGMSEAPVSLDSRRKDPSTMTDDELEQIPHAAGRDAELETDEADPAS